MASIADQDKRMMDLHELRSTTKKNMNTEYQNLLKNVKENPYLVAAVQEYKRFIDADNEVKKSQIQALKYLLKGVPAADQQEIKREIKRISQE